MKKPATVESTVLSRRIAIRLSEEDYRLLVELRLVMHATGDSHCIRSLIRLHHAHSEEARRELRRARRDPNHEKRVQALMGRRG
jgi:hypothetical protein